MARWMKVWAVALAAVVGLAPMFSQIGWAQIVSVERVFPLPQGVELSDEELLKFEGGLIDLGDLLWFDILVFGIAFSHSLGGGASFHQAFCNAMAAVNIFNLGVILGELDKWRPY